MKKIDPLRLDEYAAPNFCTTDIVFDQNILGGSGATPGDFEGIDW